MRFYQKLVYALVFALVVFFLSLGLNIIPCQTAPDVPNKVYSWGMCTLNPDKYNDAGISRLYWGYSDKFTEAYFVTMLLAFILSFVVLTLFTRRRKD